MSLRRRIASVLFAPLTRLVVLALVVGGVTLAFFLTGGIGEDDLAAAIRETGPAAAVVYVLAYALLTILLFPGSLLTAVGGVLFGTGWATLLAVIGASLGAAGAFGLGRRLGREQVARLAGRRISALDRWLTRQGFVAVLYARLIPVIPFNVLNYGAGVTGVRFRDYLLATVIGIVPGTFAYAALGGSFRDPLSPVFLTAVGLIVLLLVAGPLVNRLLRSRGAVPADLVDDTKRDGSDTSGSSDSDAAETSHARREAEELRR